MVSTWHPLHVPVGSFRYGIFEVGEVLTVRLVGNARVPLWSSRYAILAVCEVLRILFAKPGLSRRSFFAELLADCEEAPQNFHHSLKFLFGGEALAFLFQLVFVLVFLKSEMATQSTLIVERVARHVDGSTVLLDIQCLHIEQGWHRRLTFTQVFSADTPEVVDCVEMFRKDPTCRVLWYHNNPRQYAVYPDRSLFVPHIHVDMFHHRLLEMCPRVCRLRDVKMVVPSRPFVYCKRPVARRSQGRLPRRSHRVRRRKVCEFCPECS